MSTLAKRLLLAVVVIACILRPSGFTLGADPKPAAPKPAGEPAESYKLDPQMLRSIVSNVGRSEADSRELTNVFRDPGDGPAAIPVGVRLKTLDAHPLTYVRGEPIRLEVEESGDVRERHWQIEPRVSHVANPDAAKGNRVIWWCTPSSGTYTVQVTSVGRVSGIATDKLVITVIDSATDAPTDMATKAAPAAKPGGFHGGEDPTEVVKRALSKVDAAARRTDAAFVREVFANSNNLPQARAYLLRRDNSLGPDRIVAWQPFLDELEQMFEALNDAGRIPTAAHVRGAMQEIARAMQ